MSVSQKSGAPASNSEPEPGLGRASELRRLVVAHQHGDDEAFSALVRLTFPAMYRHAHRRLFDPRAAEDAVQESLLRAYRALPALRGEYQVAAWLHRIVANVCTDEGNRRRREAIGNARLSAQPEPVTPSADEAMGSTEISRMVAAAIATLPSSYREALVLRDILELEYADVASRAGITEDNARARVHRARAALRRLVDSSFVLGGTIVGGLRRIGRASVETMQHASVAASATASNATLTVTTLPPEVVAAPARMSMAAASLTAAAVAAVAAVPVFTASAPSVGNKPSTPAGAPIIRVVSPDPTTSTVVGNVIRVAVASALDPSTTLVAADPSTTSTSTPTTSSTSSTSTTSTVPARTPPQPSGSNVPVTAVAPLSTGDSTQPNHDGQPTTWQLQALFNVSGGGINASTGESDPQRLAGTARFNRNAAEVSAGGTFGGPASSDCGSQFAMRLAWTDASGVDHAIQIHGWAQSDPTNSDTWQLTGAARVDTTGSTDASPSGSFRGTLVFSGMQAGMKGTLSTAAPSASACPAPTG